MKELKIFKKKLNKTGFEILLSIQIICVLKLELIDKYLSFLEKNLTSSREIKLYKYLHKYWIKLKCWKAINYYNFINKLKNENVLPYLFITNNIIECFNGKIVKYLQRGSISAKGFIYSMSLILKDNKLMKNNIKRHDYITQALISITNKYNNKN